MNIEDFYNYCLSKKGATESFPFDENTLVFKVGNKIFLLVGLQNFDSFNVKCDPEKAIILREEYTEIIPGYHMNKKHWNTVYKRKTNHQAIRRNDRSFLRFSFKKFTKANSERNKSLLTPDLNFRAIHKFYAPNY